MCVFLFSFLVCAKFVHWAVAAAAADHAKNCRIVGSQSLLKGFSWVRFA